MKPIYEQPKAAIIRKKYPRVAILLVGLGASVMAGLLITVSNLSGETQNGVRWLLVVIIAFGFLLFLMLGRNELTRTRFAVSKEGFRPPFASFRQFLRREAPFIPFLRTTGVKCSYYMTKGISNLDEISVDLDDGSRVVIEQKDVKKEGLQALLKALDGYAERRKRGEVLVPTTTVLAQMYGVPLWIRREMWREISAILLTLLVVVMSLSLFALVPGILEFAWRPIVPLAILSVGIPLLVVMIRQAWRRARELTEQRLKDVQQASEKEHMP